MKKQDKNDSASFLNEQRNSPFRLSKSTPFTAIEKVLFGRRSLRQQQEGDSPIRIDENIQVGIRKSNSIRKSSKYSPFIINRQSITGSKKSSKLAFVDRQDSFRFPQSSSKVNLNGSQDFPNKQGQSGSLYGSKKTESDAERNLLINTRAKNLFNYKNLLRQYYNDQYIFNFRQSKRYGRSSNLQASNRRSQMIPVITRQPIIFKKKEQGFRPAQRLSGNYLCKLIDSKIFYKNVSFDNQISNKDFTKCDYIQLNPQQNISPSLQIDAQAKHLFYYSNTNNEIVILSLSKAKKSNQQICRIKARTERQNPLLYLISINNKKILMVIGGYTYISKSQEVEGCKWIEMFSIDDWGKNITKSKIIKLINGRIYPLILFPIKIQQNDSILLLGGNTIGKKIGKNLSFKDHKIINRSSNARGVFLSTKQIMDCIDQTSDGVSLPHGNNLTVQVDDKIDLSKGYVDYINKHRKQKVLLFLPKLTQFYTIKVVKKQIRIIKSKQYHERRLVFQPKASYQHLQMKSFNEKNNFQYYQINEKGFFQQKYLNIANIDDYALEKKSRCKCEFM